MTLFESQYRIRVMKTIASKLGKLGLKNKEITIYLSILSMGRGNITDISKKTGIKRTSIYQYLETLLKENLIYQTAVKKRTFYVSENPKKIIKLLENRKNEIEDRKKDIEKIMPNLESLYSMSFSKPSINFYEGKDGIKTVYNEMISSHKNIYSFFSPKKFFEIFSYAENDKLLMDFFHNGGMLYNLIEKSAETEKRLNIKKYGAFVKNKVLPDNFKFETDLLIGNDSVAMISFSNLTGVIVKDKAITDLQKNIFKHVWKSLK